MRTIILGISCLLEIIFIVFCISNKSNHTPAGYCCILGGVALLVATVILMLFPKYELPKPTGEYVVGTFTITYVDKNRLETYSNQKENRWLNVKFWYPEEMDKENYGESPLIVFSHGTFGMKESNVALYEELASHGYVVCAIDHTYQCFKTKDKKGKKIPMSSSFRSETMKENAKKNKEQSYEYYQKWMSVRTGDMNFVIDTILSNAKIDEGEYVYQLVDPSAIGVMGHSMGGSAAAGVGRDREDVKAVVVLEAPYMCDIIGVKDNTFLWKEEPYPVPVLNVYSDSSWKNLSKWTQYEENYKMLSDDRVVEEHIYIQGAGHMTLTDLAYSCPPLTLVFGQDITLNVDKTVRKLNSSILQFFDRYLKNY